MAEFAVALPVLLFIVLGFIEVARWFQAYLAVQYSAREAARYAVSGNPPRMAIEGPNSCETEKNPETGAEYPNLLSADEALWREAYRQCRFDWIVHVAERMASLGLLYDPAQTDITKPYYLGVHVRGSPAFGVDPVADEPGVARTKVEITVVFNHPVSNPFFAAMLPTIRVVGRAQMINEPWEGGGPSKPPLIPTPTALPPLDSDGDGWSDIFEAESCGTFPSNTDSDGDGVLEGSLGADDTCDHATNPCYPNSCP
jgi:hypothetical protein